MDELNVPDGVPAGSFDSLNPDLVIAAVEAFFSVRLDGMVTPYASYVNRVYGIRSDDGDEFVAKFYRPGRWSDEAILEEHQFLRDLSAAEVPVVAPLEDGDGDTLFGVDIEENETFSFALFPKRGGRGFDAESDEDWVRLGSLVGRVHLTGELRAAPNRHVLDPFGWTMPFVHELLAEEVVHPELSGEFQDIAEKAMDRAAPLLEGLDNLRLHGDCHRGNILDRSGEGLLLIDFDDMMIGPAVQDLWLLLPDHVENCGREITMLLEGYRQFRPFDTREIDAVEALRFMRMVHFLAWRSRQRHDHWFSRDFPEWGNRAFWVKEVEDLREQACHF
jgi:Ser/Thr protein kinase RdoA (MazF antagonist)